MKLKRYKHNPKAIALTPTPTVTPTPTLIG